jgi:acyl-CoA synthetase (AMP-forming)/AMP-acid ligase II
MQLSYNSPTAGLTDGRLSCAYRDIPDFFTCLDQFFADLGISHKVGLVLECLNTVTDAIVLLYLLDRGYRFLLLPRSNDRPNIPLFCNYVVTTEPVTAEGQLVDLQRPEQFVTLTQVDHPTQPIGQTETEAKLCLRTSGSTGTPKMAVHSHENLLGNVQNCVERLGLTVDDRVAIPVPLFHMYGLGAAFLPAVKAGSSVDLQQGANLLRYLQREKEFNPNIAFLTPIFCEALLKGRKSPRLYRFTVAAGDRVRDEAFAAYESQFGCLIKLYGSTEMGAIAAASPNDALEIRAHSVGQPMAGVKMRLEQGNLEPEDVKKGIGELWCYHQYGFEGYVDFSGQPTHQTEAKQEGWFRTKDLGRIGSEGQIEVLGRSDHSVNRDGLLVFFVDVEKAIETIPEIEAVAVVSKGESQRGKAIIAYCVLAKEAMVTEAEIRAACFDRLPNRAVPDQIFVVKFLPLLPNGKIDRQKLIGMTDPVQLVVS